MMLLGNPRPYFFLMQFRFLLEAVGTSVIYIDILVLKNTESVMSYVGNSRNVFLLPIVYQMHFIGFSLQTLLDIATNYIIF